MAVSMQNGGARRLLDFNTNLDVSLLEQVNFELIASKSRGLFFYKNTFFSAKLLVRNDALNCANDYPRK